MHTRFVSESLCSPDPLGEGTRKQVALHLSSIHMNKRLFVGSIAFSTTDEELREHFAEAGNVTDAKIIMDRMTNRSRGFGFVEYETAEEAQKAIEMFHDQEFQGRNLTVNEAREQAPRNDA